MAVKPNAESLSILEQIIEDRVTGLTLQFRVVPGADAPYRLSIVGMPGVGTRELIFNADGEKVAAGTAVADSCRPNWLRAVS